MSRVNLPQVTTILYRSYSSVIHLGIGFKNVFSIHNLFMGYWLTHTTLFKRKKRYKMIWNWAVFKINLLWHVLYILYQIKIKQDWGITASSFWFSISAFGQVTVNIIKSNCNLKAASDNPLYIFNQLTVGHLSWRLAVQGTFRNYNTCLSLHSEFELISTI